MPISPWALNARAVSPDGRLVAEVADLWEVAMSGPTRGRLVVSNGLARPNCGPSLVWSDDSEFIAVPEWTPTLGQRLVVLSMRRRAARYAPGAYRALELHSFSGGIVTGRDGGRAVSVAVGEIQWDGAR